MQFLISYAFLWLAVILGLIHFVGFAGRNVFNAPGHLAGFGIGLAHGFLSIIALVVSFFNKSISAYEVQNTGVGYNVGFVMGFCLWFLSGKFYKR